MNELIGSLVQLLVFSAVPLLVWFFTVRKKESFFSWIGLTKPVLKDPGKTILISALATLLYIGATVLSLKLLPEGITTAGSQFAGQGASAILSVIFYALIRTALSEEILFRGFLLKRIQAKAGYRTGNMVQALLFGLLHGIPFALVTKSVPVFVLLTLLPGGIGYFEGWLNEKQCGGSIVPGWILHGLVNLLSGILSLF